jgi:hypothetical protein
VVLLTASPVIHLESVLAEPAVTQGGDRYMCHLVAEFHSERQLKECLSGFLRDTAPEAPSVLILQCDPVVSGCQLPLKSTPKDRALHMVAVQ